MPTKAELQAQLDAMKAQMAQASPEVAEDPRIAQAVALGIPREVAVAQFTGDAVAEEKPEDRPTFHATFLRNGKPDRCMYIDDAKYIASGTIGTDGKVTRVKRFPVGLLAAMDDAGWSALRDAANRAAQCEGTYTYGMGDVFAS